MIAQEQIGLEALPYSENALVPYISTNTVSYHYGKHQRGYVDNVNRLLEQEKTFAGLSLEEIVRKSGRQSNKYVLFNNAAQAWNHAFYWKSMRPQGGERPTGQVLGLINDSYGEFEIFKEKFIDTAMSLFGSGWIWLVLENGKFRITKTSNANNPLMVHQKPLLTMDVWEHAYYLDYQNLRRKYVEAFVDHLINWEFVAENISQR